MIQVQKILDKRRRPAFQAEYLVKWTGWSIEYSTWEYKKNIKDFHDLIEEFEHNCIVSPFIYKIKTVSKSFSDNEQYSFDEDDEEEDVKNVKIIRRKGGQFGRFVVEERRQIERSVEFKIRKRIKGYWIPYEYIMKKQPEKLCHFYEQVFLDQTKRKLKWLKQINPDQISI